MEKMMNGTIASRFYQVIGFQRWLTRTMSITENIPSSAAAIITPTNHPFALDEDYMTWLDEHPSALASYKELVMNAKGKRIVVFLDYDGTLSPIVSDPDSAFMSDAMRAAVREVAARFPTAIITGRCRDKVYGFVKLDEVYYAGSHGMDIMGPPPQKLESYNDNYRKETLDKKGNKLTIFQPAQEFLPSIRMMLKELEVKTSGIKGVKIEDNRFCISVHYRHVADADYATVEDQVKSVLQKNEKKFHMTRGKKVLEIRPSIKWNKGDAVKYLLDTLGLSDSNNVLPIYIGDDTTDEDAFKVLRSRGQAYPIIVSKKPRETSALYSLRDTSEVLSFLLRLSRSATATTTT